MIQTEEISNAVPILRVHVTFCSLPLTDKPKPTHPSTLVSPVPLASASKSKAQALFPEENPVMTGLVGGPPHGPPLYGVC